METKRIQIWSGPRNISTTMMYSFAQRNDTVVVDEPLYAHYIVKYNPDHPGKEETLASMESDFEKVIQKLLKPIDKNVLYVKNMCHHLYEIPSFEFVKNFTNLVLIRDPKLVLNSLSQRMKNPQIIDTGFSFQNDLIEYFLKNDSKFIVCDSSQILKNPQKYLEKLCQYLEIDFDPNMVQIFNKIFLDFLNSLHWEAGSRPEDGAWGKWWYKNLHNSTGFEPYIEKEINLSQDLQIVYEQCLPFYQKCLQYRFEVDD